jgi:gamma-D-glutamyl-L-lysine dipeptidyl-peptidase
VGDLETQALYGQRVVVLEESGDWAKVAVEGQPTPRDGLGYPGWVPKVQLTEDQRLAGYGGKQFAQVRKATATLYHDRGLASPFIEVSYATRLPVIGRHADGVRVATPDDGDKWLRASDVTVHKSEAEIPRPTGQELVASAKTFLGTPYLWAGTSGFGFDCSGFTYTVHRAHGVTIPRDTVSRAELARPSYGEPVAGYDELREGDLLYFAYKNGTGAIHHVGMYVGGGEMIHAPSPGSEVSIVDIKGSGWIEEYAGAIRYLR